MITELQYVFHNKKQTFINYFVQIKHKKNFTDRYIFGKYLQYIYRIDMLQKLITKWEPQINYSLFRQKLKIYLGYLTQW